MEHASHEQGHAGHGPDAEVAAPQHSAGHGSHHAHMVADYRRRFWVSLVLSVPVLALAPLVQETLGVDDSWQFSGDSFIQWGFATAIYFYGGWPFLTGIVTELRSRTPGMMTLIAVAITTAYVYSSTVTFGVEGDGFFWELATLIDVMLLGHWLEMRSILGASRALELLASLMPADAHRLSADGSTVDVAVAELRPGDRVPVRPGERLPTHGVVADGRGRRPGARAGAAGGAGERGRGRARRRTRPRRARCGGGRAPGRGPGRRARARAPRIWSAC